MAEPAKISNVKEHLAEGRITEEGLAALPKLDGQELRIGRNLHNELVCKETVSGHVRGLGDPNPLWSDEEYAKKSSYGAMVAPPSYLYSVFGSGIMHGLRGVHSFHAGDDWEFYRPVMVGDRILPKAIARGYEEMPDTKFAARMIKQLQDRLYYNQRGELVAKALRWNMRTERSSARKTGKYSKLELPHPWKVEDLEKIEDEQLKKTPRGAEVRYWEDVTVGEELPTLTRGPLSLETELAWLAGNYSNFISAGPLALRVYKKHPDWAYRDTDSCALEPAAAVHWVKRAAQMAGLPACYAVGMEMHSWCGLEQRHCGQKVRR